MTLNGRLANWYQDKCRVVNFFWILAQIFSVIFVILGIVALFISPTVTAFGVCMKVFHVYIICLVAFMFFYKLRMAKNIRTNELYIGYYNGICIMACLHLVVVSVLYATQSNLIEITQGNAITISVYRCMCALSIFLIFFYILYVYLSIHFHNEIIKSLKKEKAPVTETQTVNEAPYATSEMVLFKQPTVEQKSTVQMAPAGPTIQSPPSSENNQLVLSKPTAPGVMAPPSLALSAPVASPLSATTVPTASTSSTARPVAGLLPPPGL